MVTCSAKLPNSFLTAQDHHQSHVPGVRADWVFMSQSPPSSLMLRSFPAGWSFCRYEVASQSTGVMTSQLTQCSTCCMKIPLETITDGVICEVDGHAGGLGESPGSQGDQMWSINQSVISYVLTNQPGVQINQRLPIQLFHICLVIGWPRKTHSFRYRIWHHFCGGIFLP